jgi:hypothetical protein
MIYHPVLKRMVPRPTEFRGSEQFDRELHHRNYDKYATEMAELEQQKLTSSPEVNAEMAVYQYERNYALAGPQRWKGQERWIGRENEAMRLVNILHPHTFMRRLQRVGVDARIDYSRHARLWLNDGHTRGRIGVNGWLIEDDVRIARTLTTLQYPYGPEYEIMRFDKYDVPTEPKYRGWRTVLLELIRNRVITEEEATRAFGPATGPAATAYLAQLQVYRQARTGMAA